MNSVSKAWHATAAGAICVALIAMASTSCVPRPRIGSSSLAPNKLRCDHKSDPECDEYLKGYLNDNATFTCVEGSTECRPPIVEGCSDYFLQSQLVDRFSGERGRVTHDFKEGERPYTMGLALAGGGTKAASYATGILAGLYDSTNTRQRKVGDKTIDVHLGDRLDGVSSVSGGSYAALWYFSRLIDTYQIVGEHLGDHQSFAKSFDDCLPHTYRGLDESGTSVCPNTPSQFDVDDPERNDRGLRPDPYRFQNQLRGFQDLFGENFDLEPEVSGEKEQEWDRGVLEFLYTLPALPAHWLLKGVFDWKDFTVSLSGLRYFDGINRTYALRPANCGEFTKDVPVGTEAARDEPCMKTTGRPAPNSASSRGHTMAALANLYYNQDGVNQARLDRKDSPLARVPFWIANTTAGVERHLFSFDPEERPDLEDAVFEFTPYSFGSRHYGRWVGSPPDLDISRVAGASGAFLDAQQRTQKPVSNFFGSLGMDIFAASWGISIPNPRWRDEMRTRHRFYPWPFYLFHHDRSTNDGAWIRLSDGGQSENLGVWSLVRRGTTTILIADEAEDGNGNFSDVCYLKRRLAAKKLFLHVPDLEDFERVCSGDGSHYDLWAWPVRYVRGCITDKAPSTGEAPTCASRSKHYFAKLIIFKPAINLDALSDPLNDCPPAGLDSGSDQPQAAQCRTALAKLRELSDYTDFPAELFGFLVRNPRTTPVTPQSFPQNSTVWMTLNSSPTLFGAYRELAKWQMRNVMAELESPSQSEGPRVEIQPPDR